MRFQGRMSIRKGCALLLVAAVISGCASAPPPPPEPEQPQRPMSWERLSALTAPPSNIDILPYAGDVPEQIGELRLPAQGPGPFPLVIVIHGGCWRSQVDYQHVRPLAQALTSLGVATWTIEYRRVGDALGGWPRTFRDVGLAADYVRTLAEYYPIDASRVVALGHSAGGQLALWLAGRDQLPEDSPLYAADPLPLRGVVGLAAVTDLAAYRIGPENSCHAAVDEVLGGDPEDVPERYAQTSPAALLPLGVPLWFVHGANDTVVAPETVAVFADNAVQTGDTVTIDSDADAGHFDLAAPLGSAWPLIQRAVMQALSGTPEPQTP